MRKSTLFAILSIVLFVCGCEQKDEILREEIPAETRQYRYTDFQLITPCEAINLLYYIDPECEGTVMEPIIPQAIDLYNAAPISLHYMRTYDLNIAHLVIDCEETIDVSTGARWLCGGGEAYTPVVVNDCQNVRNLAPECQYVFPSGGSLGREVSLGINWDESTCPCSDPDDCSFTDGVQPDFLFKLIVHEIGHTIGLHHNENDDSFFDTEHIPNTEGDTWDPGSPFNTRGAAGGCELCEGVTGFNDNDIIALQTLYPCGCPPEIIGLGSICEPSIVLYCIGNADDEIEWLIPDAVAGSTENCVEIEFENSSVDIAVKVITKGCTYVIDRTIQFGIPKPPQISVEFDPCFELMNLTDLANINIDFPDWHYEWIVSGLNNTPHVAMNVNPAQVRGSYEEGEYFCIELIVSNECGSSSSTIPLCFVAPACEDNITVIGTPTECGGEWQCPEGFECIEGNCIRIGDEIPCGHLNPCPEGMVCQDGVCVNQTEPCGPLNPCPMGYICLEGHCVFDDSAQCENNSDCPPGYLCKKGKCVKRRF